MVKKIKKTSGIALSGRISIKVDAKTLLGKGRIELLERIKETGSVRKAAMQMGMSYRKAWFAIDTINKLTANTYVVLHRGGKAGSNATITDIAEKAIVFYKAATEKLELFLKEQTKEIKF